MKNYFTSTLEERILLIKKFKDNMPEKFKSDIKKTTTITDEQ